MNLFNDILFKAMIESWFFSSKLPSNYRDKNRRGIEFIITPECSKSCGICYLQKHKDKLYPKSIVNEDIILSNLRSVLNYMVKNSKKAPLIDLFSGEIWGEEFGFNILNTMLEYANKFKYTDGISIATNMDFLFTENGEKWMDFFIEEFDKIGIKFNISASIDGLFLDDCFRPQNKNYNIKIDYNSEYYNKIFSFQSKYNFGFHPMVYSKNCKYWCDNFDWYVGMIERYYPNSIRKTPMMLEVRDNNWSSEDLEYYKVFLNHVVDYYLGQVYHNDLVEFSKFLTRIRGYEAFINNNVGIYVYDGRLNCTIPNELFIRLGDLAIVPCHRTMYPENVYGYIHFSDKEMLVKAENFELMRKILREIPRKDYPKCKECIYNRLCMKGCLGSQLENSGDIFEPCDSVCKMLKAKINFLVDRYTELGVYEVLKQFPETKEYINIVEEFKNKRIMSGDISDIK